MVDHSFFNFLLNIFPFVQFKNKYYPFVKFVNLCLKVDNYF